MTAGPVAGQLDLFAVCDECPHCSHESDIHYPPSVATKGCRVFTCRCPGWVSDKMREQAARAVEEWAARFARAEWVAPWDCSGGLRKGQSVLGWVCPACGQVEVNEFLLAINHGYDPQVPGRAPFGAGFGEACSRQRLLASQERSRLAREAKAARS